MNLREFDTLANKQQKVVRQSEEYIQDKYLLEYLYLRFKQFSRISSEFYTLSRWEDSINQAETDGLITQSEATGLRQDMVILFKVGLLVTHSKGGYFFEQVIIPFP